MKARRASSSPLPLWLLPLVACGGVAVAVILVTLTTPEPARPISEVRAEIAELVLRKSDLPNATDGGSIGPWWVSARNGDASQGEFADFQLKSGSMQVAAKRARLVIDADLTAFSFELEEVVIMRVPDAGEDAGVVHLDRYTLGPAPLRGHITRDEPTLGIVRARE